MSGKFLKNFATLSYVMGAPNADTVKVPIPIIKFEAVLLYLKWQNIVKGAVYLCTDCFGEKIRVKATMGVLNIHHYQHQQ